MKRDRLRRDRGDGFQVRPRARATLQTGDGA
jgi:hypothetical protein